MFVFFTNSQKLIDIKQDQIEKFVSLFLSHHQLACDEVSVNFVGKDEITELHKVYFDDPTPTDCISFPIDHPDQNLPFTVLGEVFVCPEVALDYAKKNHVDFGKELSLYLAHGLLHLIGYDDIEESDRILMRQKEKETLDFLEKNQALLTPLSFCVFSDCQIL